MVGLVIVLETVLEAVTPSDGVAHAAMKRIARRESERRLGGVEHELMQGVLQNGDHVAILFLLHHSPQPGIKAGVCGSRGIIRHREKRRAKLFDGWRRTTLPGGGGRGRGTGDDDGGDDWDVVRVTTAGGLGGD